MKLKFFQVKFVRLADSWWLYFKIAILCCKAKVKFNSMDTALKLKKNDQFVTLSFQFENEIFQIQPSSFQIEASSF